MRLIVLGFVGLLAGCGGADKEAGAPVPGPVMPAPTPVPTAPTPSPNSDMAPASTPTPQPLPSTAAASDYQPCPPVSPDVFCSGPIIVRASTPVLVKDGRATSDGEQRVRATIGYSVESRSGGQLKLNLADQEAKLTLPEISTVLASRVRSDDERSGITPCRQPRDACVQGQSQSFLTVEPGASPPRFQLFYRGWADGSVASQLATLTSADAEFEIYLITPDGQSQTMSVSFARLPLTNQIAQ